MIRINRSMVICLDPVSIPLKRRPSGYMPRLTVCFERRNTAVDEGPDDLTVLASVEACRSNFPG